MAHFRIEPRPCIATLHAGMRSARMALALLCFASGVFAQTSAPPARLQSKQGAVDYSKAATTNWNAAPLGQPLAHYDRLRTLELSEAAWPK
jgi:hypothetical protein